MRDLQDKCHVWAWFVNPTARIIFRIPGKSTNCSRMLFSRVSVSIVGKSCSVGQAAIMRPSL